MARRLPSPGMSALSILVVGHGYLGRELAEGLHRGGHRVAAFHRGDSSETIYPVYRGDLTSRQSLRELREKVRPDSIVHCASSSRGGPDSYRAIFVEGLKSLAAIFPGVPILFTSSTSVYAQTDGSLVDEAAETSPSRETGRLLLEAEAIARDSGGIALRLAGLYGPGRSVHLRRILEGTATIEDVEPSRYLNQIHRDDAAGAIVHLLSSGELNLAGRVFNAADDAPLTQRDCYESLAGHFGLPLPPLAPPDPGRKRGWTHKRVSNAALRATGWQPRFPSFLGAIDGDPRLVPSIRDSIAL